MLLYSIAFRTVSLLPKIILQKHASFIMLIIFDPFDLFTSTCHKMYLFICYWVNGRLLFSLVTFEDQLRYLPYAI